MPWPRGNQRILDMETKNTYIYIYIMLSFLWRMRERSECDMWMCFLYSPCPCWLHLDAAGFCCLSVPSLQEMNFVLHLCLPSSSVLALVKLLLGETVNPLRKWFKMSFHIKKTLLMHSTKALEQKDKTTHRTINIFFPLPNAWSIKHYYLLFFTVTPFFG